MSGSRPSCRHWAPGSSGRKVKSARLDHLHKVWYYPGGPGHGAEYHPETFTLEERSKIVQTKGFFGALFDLSFSEFVTTKLIKVLYVLLLILIAIGFLIVFFGGIVGLFRHGGFAQGLLTIVLAPIGALLYVILARMWMELVIVLFRIAENTTELVRMKKHE
jgi:hypothetical protein